MEQLCDVCGTYFEANMLAYVCEMCGPGDGDDDPGFDQGDTAPGRPGAGDDDDPGLDDDDPDSNSGEWPALD